MSDHSADDVIRNFGFNIIAVIYKAMSDTNMQYSDIDNKIGWGNNKSRDIMISIAHSGDNVHLKDIASIMWALGLKPKFSLKRTQEWIYKGKSNG